MGLRASVLSCGPGICRKGRLHLGIKYSYVLINYQCQVVLHQFESEYLHLEKQRRQLVSFNRTARGCGRWARAAVQEAGRRPRVPRGVLGRRGLALDRWPGRLLPLSFDKC